MRTMITSVVVSVLLGGFTVVAAQLPPEIMVDRYLLKAEQSIRRGLRGIPRRKETMERVLSLQEKYGLKPAPEDHFRYAKVWHASGSRSEHSSPWCGICN